MSAGDVVVDDHLLLRVLLDDEPAELRPRGGGVFTTGLWYHRLCRAIANPAVVGALSRSLGDVDPFVGAKAVRAVVELPEAIGLVSMRSLAWPMAEFVAEGERLNPMSVEALAAATQLDASICLAAADTNPPLIAAATRAAIDVRIL